MIKCSYRRLVSGNSGAPGVYMYYGFYHHILALKIYTLYILTAKPHKNPEHRNYKVCLLGIQLHDHMTDTNLVAISRF